MIQGAPKQQYYLELGSYFIRKGTGYKIGDTFEYGQHSTKKKNGLKIKTFYIRNLYFNFNLNKVTYNLSKEPILNHLEQER